MATPILQSSFALTCKLPSHRGGDGDGAGDIWVLGWGKGGCFFFFRPSPPENLIVNTRNVNFMTGLTPLTHAGENLVCRWQILWDPERGELGRSDII